MQRPEVMSNAHDVDDGAVIHPPELAADAQYGDEDEDADFELEHIPSAKTKRPRKSKTRQSTSEEPNSTDATPEPGSRRKGGNKRKYGHEYCLTCKKYGRACSGRLPRLDGGCSVCRDPDREKGEKLRECLWAIPEKGIHTYDEARAAHKAEQKALREARKAAVQQQRKDAASTRKSLGTKQLNVLPPPRRFTDEHFIYSEMTRTPRYDTQPPALGNSVRQYDDGGMRQGYDNEAEADTRIHRPQVIRLLTADEESTQNQTTSPMNNDVEQVYRLTKPLQLAPPPRLQTSTSATSNTLPARLIDPNTGQWYEMVDATYTPRGSSYMPIAANNAQGYISPYDARPTPPPAYSLQPASVQHDPAMPRSTGKPARKWSKQGDHLVSVDGADWTRKIWSPQRKRKAERENDRLRDHTPGTSSSDLTSLADTSEGELMTVDVHDEEPVRRATESGDDDVQHDEQFQDNVVLTGSTSPSLSRQQSVNADSEQQEDAVRLSSVADVLHDPVSEAESEDDRLLGILGRLAKERDAAMKKQPIIPSEKAQTPRPAIVTAQSTSSESRSSTKRTREGSAPRRGTFGPLGLQNSALPGPNTTVVSSSFQTINKPTKPSTSITTSNHTNHTDDATNATPPLTPGIATSQPSAATRPSIKLKFKMPSEVEIQKAAPSKKEKEKETRKQHKRSSSEAERASELELLKLKNRFPNLKKRKVSDEAAGGEKFEKNSPFDTVMDG